MKFEVVKDEHRKFPDAEIKLPERKTKYSAGYDFYSNEDKLLAPNETYIFWTDTKLNMEFIPINFWDKDKQLNSLLYLQLSIRSSLANEGLQLANAPGIVDEDYYGNKGNDGNIGFMIKNYDDRDIVIHKGDRIGQGIILTCWTLDDDISAGKREGGYGSTGK